MNKKPDHYGGERVRKPLIDSPDILQRIKGAKERLRDGHALMRVPVDPTDPDCVLADAELEIERLRAALAQKAVPIAVEPIEAAEKIAGLLIKNPSNEMGPSDEPESQYRLGYKTAIEDLRMNLEAHDNWRANDA